MKGYTNWSTRLHNEDENQLESPCEQVSERASCNQASIGVGNHQTPRRIAGGGSVTRQECCIWSGTIYARVDLISKSSVS